MTSPRLESKAPDEEVIHLPLDRFAQFCRTIRKFPEQSGGLEAIFSADADEPSKKYTKSKNAKRFTQDFVSPYETEKDYLYARKTWGEMVSETDSYLSTGSSIARRSETGRVLVPSEVKDTPAAKAKIKVLDRLLKMGCKTPESVLNDVIHYLQEKTVIVFSFTFRESFLEPHGFSSFQLMNLFETEAKKTGNEYKSQREKTEIGLLQHLTSETKQRMTANPLARPRYAALLMWDHDIAIQPVVGYGTSYMVLQQAAKLGALFAPYDTYDYNAYTGENYQLGTYSHFEVLLSQCSDPKLQAIVDRVIKGALPKGYDQHKPFGIKTRGIDKVSSYMEVLLPAIDFFDPGLVQHIHLDLKSLGALKADKVADFQQSLDLIRGRGITVTCHDVNPYPSLQKQLLSMPVDDPHVILSILNKHPALLHTVNAYGHELIHLAILKGYEHTFKMLWNKGAKYNPTNTTHAEETLLFLAAFWNQKKIAEVLLQPDILSHYNSKQLNLAIHHFESCAQFGLLNQLYQSTKKQKRGDLDSIFHEDSVRAIHDAILQKSSLDKIKLLCNNTKYIYIESKEHGTPLSLAIKSNRLDVVCYFVHKNMIEYCLQAELAELADFLIQNKAWGFLNKILKKWIFSWDNIDLDSFMKKGGPLNYIKDTIDKVNNFHAFLVSAIKYGRKEVISYILVSAIESGNKEVIPYVFSILFRAISSGDFSNAEKLLNHYKCAKDLGQIKDKDSGNTLLQEAIVKKYSFDFISNLLKQIYFFSDNELDNTRLLNWVVIYKRYDVLVHLLEDFSHCFSKTSIEDAARSINVEELSSDALLLLRPYLPSCNRQADSSVTREVLVDPSSERKNDLCSTKTAGGLAIIAIPGIKEPEREPSLGCLSIFFRLSKKRQQQLQDARAVQSEDQSKSLALSEEGDCVLVNCVSVS